MPSVGRDQIFAAMRLLSTLLSIFEEEVDQTPVTQSRDKKGQPPKGETGWECVVQRLHVRGGLVGGCLVRRHMDQACTSGWPVSCFVERGCKKDAAGLHLEPKPTSTT